VVGLITGLKEGKIGIVSYRFVTMNATGYKRWHLVQQVIIPPAPIGPGRNWGYRYGWYNSDPAQVQIIVTEYQTRDVNHFNTVTD